MYGWPKFPDRENSPDEMQRYRAYYSLEMQRALGANNDWRYTPNSHIYEAVWIAAISQPRRTEICAKIIQHALQSVRKSEVEIDGLSILYDIGINEMNEKDWEELKLGVKSLMTMQ